MKTDVIIKEYTDLSGITLEELQSKSQKQNLVVIRQCICHSLYNQHCSFSEIGRLLNRKHSTVIASIKRVNDYIFTKDEIIKPYRTLLDKYKN